jgi:hypothetical protein
MRGADQTDRDGINDGAGAMINHLVKAAAIPCSARDLDKGAPLRRCLEMALTRRHESGRKLRDIPQPCMVA